MTEYEYTKLVIEKLIAEVGYKKAMRFANEGFIIGDNFMRGLSVEETVSQLLKDEERNVQTAKKADKKTT